jgi:hypothetical protein
MSLVQQAQAELAQKGSRRATASDPLSDALRARVLELMEVAPALTYASIATTCNNDPSAFRKWVIGSRPRIRTNGQRVQSLSVGKALRLAHWLEAQSTEEPAPPAAQTSSSSDAVRLRAKLLGFDAQALAASAGVTVNDAQAALAGTSSAPLFDAWLDRDLLPDGQGGYVVL